MEISPPEAFPVTVMVLPASSELITSSAVMASMVTVPAVALTSTL